MGTQMTKCCAQSFVSQIDDADDEIFGTKRAVDIDEKAKLLRAPSQSESALNEEVSVSSEGNISDDSIILHTSPRKKSHSISTTDSLSALSGSDTDYDVNKTNNNDKAKHIEQKQQPQQQKQAKKSKYQTTKRSTYPGTTLPGTPYPKVKVIRPKKLKSAPSSRQKLRSRAIMREKSRIRNLRKCISANLEQELEATEIELMTHKHALELLKAQNDQLRAQNEQFISKYGAHFGYNNDNNNNPNNSQNLGKTAAAPISPVYTTSITPMYTRGPAELEALGHGSSMSKSMSYSLEAPVDENVEVEHLEVDSQNPLFSLTHSQTRAIIGFTQSSRDLIEGPRLSHRRSQSMPIQPHDLNEEEEEELEMNDECKSVDNCKAVKRLVIALKWYAEAEGDSDGLMKKMKDSAYDKHIVNDYQHLLNHHGVHDYDDNGSTDYQLLQSMINKLVKPCDTLKCDGYKRHDEIMKKNLNGSGFDEFSIEFMDLVHCALMHSKDSMELNEDFVELHD